MGNLVHFKKREETLEDLLKRAHVLKNETSNVYGKLINIPNSKKYFETVLINEILKRNLISKEMFLCATYISTLMEKFVHSNPDFFFAIDYILRYAENDDEQELKKGADYCFTICSLFVPRTEARCMKKSDYVSIGRGMYMSYYQKTGTEVAYLMSESFDQMAHISSECFTP